MNLRVEDTKEGLKKLIFNWIFLSFIILLVLFLTFKMFYYKYLLEKVTESEKILKNNLKDAEILIKKYQIQLQRALGNLSLLEEEIDKLKKDLKAVKSRNVQYRIENEQLRRKIKELENKIEALL
jgi:peptidoglycan hydrolase CwlO-like protein